jgi:hypothetical protein
MHSKRCPHTGVVNYFTEADPLLAVGSVAESREAPGFAWRCYIGEESGGLAPDLARAEARLARAVEQGEVQASAWRHGGRDPAASSPAVRHW